jgi:hypothetical protein
VYGHCLAEHLLQSHPITCESVLRLGLLLQLIQALRVVILESGAHLIEMLDDLGALVFAKQMIQVPNKAMN